MQGILRVLAQPCPLARIWEELLPGWQSQAAVGRRAGGALGSQETSPSRVLGLLSHIPTFLLTAQKFLPGLSAHGAFIHSPGTSLLLSGTLFPANPLFPTHFEGLTLEASSSRKPPPPSMPSNMGQTPDSAVLPGRPALSSALTPGGSRCPAPCRALQRAGSKSTVLSPGPHTPRRALSAFSISTCQMNEGITRTNKSHS